MFFDAPPDARTAAAQGLWNSDASCRRELMHAMAALALGDWGGLNLHRSRARLRTATLRGSVPLSGRVAGSNGNRWVAYKPRRQRGREAQAATRCAGKPAQVG